MTDEQMLALWLHGRPAATQRAYRLALDKLRKRAGLHDMTLPTLQAHVSALAHLAPRSRALATSAIKSFYVFHVKCGTLATNPAAQLADTKIPSDLAERILSAAETERLIGAAGSPQEGVLLRTLYTAGLRASELCGLRWRHLTASERGHQLTVTGKGGKTRSILIPLELYGDLRVLEPDAARPGDPIFSGKHGLLGPRQLLRIVKRAAARAGLSDKVSSHWLRHAHASHALDAGAPITLVRDTLGHSSIATTDRYAHARPNDGSARYLAR